MTKLFEDRFIKLAGFTHLTGRVRVIDQETGQSHIFKGPTAEADADAFIADNVKPETFDVTICGFKMTVEVDRSLQVA